MHNLVVALVDGMGNVSPSLSTHQKLGADEGWKRGRSSMADAPLLSPDLGVKVSFSAIVD